VYRRKERWLKGGFNGCYTVHRFSLLKLQRATTSPKQADAASREALGLKGKKKSGPVTNTEDMSAMERYEVRSKCTIVCN